jgi:hypothetical protein
VWTPKPLFVCIYADRTESARAEAKDAKTVAQGPGEAFFMGREPIAMHAAGSIETVKLMSLVKI